MDEVENHERAVHAGRNQSLFREVNEQIGRLAGDAALALGNLDAARADEYSWVCECADRACVERVTMTLAEYEVVRANEVHFVIAPSASHFEPAAEHVLERHQRYWVVVKFGAAAESAKKMREAGSPGSK
jgi:hypothetical protein